jgi:hypothetical protein
MGEYHPPAGTRPIAAGLLIALAAPPLGLSAITAWFTIGLGEFSISNLPVESGLPVSYLFGGIQACLAGAFVGWVIYRQGWVSPGAWMLLTIILGLAPVVGLMLTRPESEYTGLIYVSDFKVACYLMAAAFFASFVLRVVLIALGWMRKP